MPAKKATAKPKAKTTTRKRASTRKPAASKQEQQPQEDTRYFMRNARNAPVSFRLTRQQEGRLRTELKPRGQRGDMQLLQPEDVRDPIVDEQLSYGLIEIITAKEAAEVAKKQTTNQKQVHPALATLRSETGKEYEGGVQVMPEFNSQGVTVAQTKEGQIAIGRGGIQREGIISDGFEAARQRAAAEQVPQGDEVAAAQDQAARDARGPNVQGPQAALGGLAVSVDPVQKT